MAKSSPTPRPPKPLPINPFNKTSTHPYEKYFRVGIPTNWTASKPYDQGLDDIDRENRMINGPARRRPPWARQWSQFADSSTITEWAHREAQFGRNQGLSSKEIQAKVVGEVKRWLGPYEKKVTYYDGVGQRNTRSKGAGKFVIDKNQPDRLIREPSTNKGKGSTAFSLAAPAMLTGIGSMMSGGFDEAFLLNRTANSNGGGGGGGILKDKKKAL